MPSIKKLLSFVGKKKNQGSKLDYSNGYDNMRHAAYTPGNVYLNHNPPPPHTLAAQRQQLYAQHQIIPSSLPAVPAPQTIPLQPQHQFQHHSQAAVTAVAAAPQCVCQNCSFQPNTATNFSQTSQVHVLPHHQQAQLNSLGQQHQQSPQQQQQQQFSQQLVSHQVTQQLQHQQMHGHQDHHQQQHQHHQQQTHLQQLQQSQHQQQLHQHQQHQLIQQHQFQPQTHIQQQHQQSLNLHPSITNQTYASQGPNQVSAIAPSAAQCVCANCSFQQPQQPNQQQLQNQLQHQFHQQNHHHQQQQLQQQHAIVSQQQLATQVNDSYQHQTMNQPIQQQQLVHQLQHQHQQTQQPQYHNHGHQVHQTQVNNSNAPEPVATTVNQQTNQALLYQQHQTITNQSQQLHYQCHTIQPHQYEQQKQQYQQLQQQQQHHHQRVQSLCVQSVQPTVEVTSQDQARPQTVQASRRIEQQFDLKAESQDSRYANMQSIQSSQGIKGYFKESSNPKFEEHVYCNQQKAVLPPYEPPPSYDTFMECKVKHSSIYSNGHQYPTCRSESIENKDSSYENVTSRNSTYSNLAVGKQELGHTGTS